MTSSVTGGCPLALVILLLVSMDPTATEVVRSVRNCAQFFLEGTPPEIPGVLKGGDIVIKERYETICQEYESTMRFMTLYDTLEKIPVFSAYIYTGHIKGRASTNWKTEPELEDKQQATRDWPKGSSHDKGHLYPCFHANSKDDQKSTFKLTNCVPQVKSFNRGRWCKMEKYVKGLMDGYCSNQNNKLEAFVLTGAVPSDTYMGSGQRKVASVVRKRTLGCQ
ncbi:endonuclease domain-containing 1 protein-like [Gadus chalcogrammus]|uniref:endonuclease domain-containing 1 protein-like n=1 Tax=Gadus chalcogrammus TaxID=1042646 RepID=UPI0024C47A5A|nr:endonuclease domain-containing 1 protein-like [Gadus chalcogrammus]